MALITKFIIVSLIVFLTLSVVYQVKLDLDSKMKTENDLITREIDRCTLEYYENRCEPGQRVRAAEAYCQEMEICKNRDPLLVNKNTKIMVKLLAEIINDFFEPLSYKTMAFLVISLVSMLVLSECAGRRPEKKKSKAIVKKDI